MRKLEEMDWWGKLVEIKDDFSLRELAEIFEATPGAINNALKRNGIERKSAPPGPRSRRPDKGTVIAEIKATYGASVGRPKKTKKAEKAKKTAKTTKSGKSGRGGKTGARGPRASTAAKIDPYKDQLGVTADATIAEKAGVSVQTVARYRKDLGIKASRKRKSSAAPAAAAAPAAPEAGKKRRGKRSKIEKFHDLVGQVSDAEIAQLSGVQVQSVQNYRRKHNIAAPAASAPAAIARPAPTPTPAPVAAAPASSAPVSSASLAYRVGLGDRTVIVVAPDIVAAATKAMETGESVGIIELVGEVLG